MRTRNATRQWILALGFVGLALVGVIYLMLRPEAARPGDEGGIVERAAPTAGTGVSPVLRAEPEPSATAIPGSTLLDQAWHDLIARAEAAVAQGPDRTRHFVYGLFAELDRLSPADRLEVVLGFFESGLDVGLGGRMTLGRGGILQDWPTLRTALFDYLSQRDGSAARDLAQLLLQTRPAEPGEWTLALRELARGRTVPEWPSPVQQRLEEFIADEQWQRQGAISWLEGFDLVVAGRAPSRHLPNLASVVGSGHSRAAQFAAFLAADRLMLAAPEETLSVLNANPQLFTDQADLRAGLFARADVRQPEQRQQLETYFRRSDIAAEEREAFADLFPHYDLAVSFNLLTPPSSRSLADMIAHDRAAATRLETWLSDPSLSEWHAGLQDARDRLREHLAEADRGR